MSLKKYSVFLFFIAFVFSFYGVSKIIFPLIETDKPESINRFFLFFTAISFVMLLVHFIVYLKKKEQLGFVFLATLTFKVITSYVYVNQISEVSEKRMAILYFFVFLIIDVLLTAVLLNKKE